MSTKLTANFAAAFKEADIRGVYPRDIDDEVVYLIARAFVEQGKYTKVIMGCDMRISSPALSDAFVRGATDAGATVVDIGLVTTPMLYFASATRQLPGVMITASHSPKDENGLKLVIAGATPLTEKTGLGKIRKSLEIGRFLPSARRPGKVIKKDVCKDFSRYILRGYRPVRGMVHRVVVDCGSGMGTLLLPLLEQLGLSVTPLFPELDGTFPHRASNPTIPKNQKAISAALKTGEYDFGIALDGDADRVAFFDERGRYVNCGAIGALIAERLLPHHPGAVMVGTVLTSRAFREAVTTHGGKHTYARVGHSYVKEVMRKRDALFGCEHSGHFFYKDFFYTDSVILTVRQVLAAYQTAGVAFSALVSPYTTYIQTDDLMINVKDKWQFLKKLKTVAVQEKEVRLSEPDGLFLDYGDVWVAIKPSVTEAAINVIAEGVDRKRVVALRDRLVAEVRRLA